ncbi:hypothetical protein KP509_21G004300 [Ceratopteris richardii]|uniref:Uncharacterized protein n=1 Tax=Ceratopteris richardii TaxID=49495 RepID=A0A8T2S746_CERRI|nr:hypothetical protein KP509_21G004300 [Ceratopteris richardii]
MLWSRSKFGSANANVVVDLGHPFINWLVDCFLKVGAIAGFHAIAQGLYDIVRQEKASKRSLEFLARRTVKEALRWGLVGAIYVGMVYAVQEARGIRDWKNVLVGGALAGTAFSFMESNAQHNRIVSSAITGGAIATAAELLRIST